MFSLPSDGGLREVCRRIRDGGLDQRVCIESYAVDPEDVPTLCSCQAVTSVMVSSFHFVDVAALGNAFNVIATCDHVTSLRVFLDFFDNDAFASLAAYISGATSLRAIKLVIEIYGSDDEGDEILHEDDESLRQSISNLCEALSSNDSLTNIYLDSTIELRDQDCRVFADAALNNRQLYELILAAVKNTSVAVFLGRLLPRLGENYNLLRLEIPACLQPNDDMCAAQDVVRRNCDLINRATRFVMGDHGSECARPFELLSGHPALVENVLRKATWTKTDEAVAMTRNARQVLRNADLHMYMRLTGVVKERVECEVQEDGGAQLDQLNHYCWLEIARYLKLADIVEPQNILTRSSTL
ncbi:uncharacterized protein LOC125945323 [Dermacentor silvarum]|uniref:uncharacterized protein LOC125945323 n=1 Tax=Dermacentor silvarum TaxID=543639 RepID=UPI00210081DB|nr:uncharacterized protein LOC125945323 [Dermacentor silvarum]